MPQWRSSANIWGEEGAAALVIGVGPRLLRGDDPTRLLDLVNALPTAEGPAPKPWWRPNVD